MKYSFLILFVLCIFSCKTDESSDIAQRKIDSLTNKLRMDSIALENKLLKSQLAEREKEPKSLTELYNKLKRSVFLVKTRNGFSEGLGTAFMVSENGKCLTNYHVLENAHDAYLLDYLGNKYSIERIISNDDDMDYVYFTIDNKNNLPPINIASKSPEIGEAAFAIGNPMGLEQTLSEGIVSGFRSEKYIIQTTTEINHGSSGGPLFNRKGEAIGITTAMLNTQGNLNFAMNINKLPIRLPSGKREKLSEENTTRNDNISLPPIIRTFIQAEDAQDFSLLYSCFVSKPKKYWDIDYPTYSQLVTRYRDIWSKIESPRNNITRVEKIGNNQYRCTIDFSFYSKKYRTTKRKENTKVTFTLNNTGNKIVAIEGK